MRRHDRYLKLSDERSSGDDDEPESGESNSRWHHPTQACGDPVLSSTVFASMCIERHG